MSNDEETSLKSFWMPPPVFFPADFELLIEGARHRRDDLSVAGQPSDLLAFLYQSFVG